MKTVFADTFYFLALLNQRDPAHQKAVAASAPTDLSFVTTEFVLVELGDALRKPPVREEFQKVCALIKNTATCRVISASSELYEQGSDLYRIRTDKDWQLTDCISFVVMRAEKLEAALTGDRHFEQAGFK